MKMKSLQLSSMYRTFLRRSYLHLCSLRPLNTPKTSDKFLSKVIGNSSSSNNLRYYCNSSVNTSTVDSIISSQENHFAAKPVTDITEIPHLSDDEFFKVIIDLRNSFQNKSNQEVKQSNEKSYISAIETECVRRAKRNWDLDKTLNVVNMFFPAAKLLCSDLLFWLLRNRFKRAMKSPVPIMMKYIDVINKNNFWNAYYINWYHTECTLIRNLEQFNLPEISSLLKILNKRSAVIVSQELISDLYNRLMKEIDEVDSHVLSIFLLFFSNQRTSNIDFNPLMDVLCKRLPDLHYSIYENTSRFCTRKKLYHPGILDHLAKYLTTRLPDVNISELETIVASLVFFNYNFENFYQTLIDSFELEPLRTTLHQHPKKLVKIIFNLGLVGVYPYNYVNHILSEEFLRNTYGKKLNKYTVPREVIILSSSIKEEYPDYEGNKLNECLEEELLNRSATHIHNYLQTEGETIINLKRMGEIKYHPTLHNRMILEIRKILTKLLGDPKYVHTCYVLPFLPKPDLLFCLDRDKNPIKLPNELLSSVRVNYKNLDKSKRWYVVIPTIQNPVLKGENAIFYGKIIAKERILRKLGFDLITVVEEIWSNFEEEQKENYLSKFIL